MIYQTLKSSIYTDTSVGVMKGMRVGKVNDAENDVEKMLPDLDWLI